MGEEMSRALRAEFGRATIEISAGQGKGEGAGDGA